jgi:hypothetical protein
LNFPVTSAISGARFQKPPPINSGFHGVLRSAKKKLQFVRRSPPATFQAVLKHFIGRAERRLARVYDLRGSRGERISMASIVRFAMTCLTSLGKD